MNISSASTKIKAIVSPSSDNSDIKFLEKQKEKLQAQIQKVKQSKIEEKLKQEKVKELQAQIDQTNIDIQRIRMEQLKQNREAEAMTESENNKANEAEKGGQAVDQVDLTSLLQAGTTYSNIKTMNKVKNNMSSHAKILKNEIKSDEGTGHFAKNKREELSKLEQRTEALDGKVGKFQKKAIQQSKEHSSKNAIDKTETKDALEKIENANGIASIREDKRIEQQEEALKKAYKKIDVRL